MSLQEISSLPPNKIVDERGEGNRSGYRSAQRLWQLTEKAVDKALKLQAESGRLVDVVDTQSCGELGEFGRLIKYPFFPSALKILKNAAILFPSSSSSRNWALPKESQDRRTTAEKIYSSLIHWRSDVSFEWSSRVALAVPVLEEALYKVARSKEDYASEQLFEHVLLHFEAGNGLFLLQGTKPLYPVQASCAASMMGQGTSEHIFCDGTGDLCQVTHDDALPWKNATVLPANNDSSSGSDCESCLTDNRFWWDGLEMGHPAPIKVAAHKHRDNSGKRITNRVVSMLSKRSDNLAQPRHELINATHNEENIPSAGVTVDDARIQMQNDGGSFEPSHIKQEKPCYGAMRTRKNSRKTLGDMINVNLTNLPAIRIALSNGVEEACSMYFMSEDSNCSKSSNMVHSSCTLKAGPMRREGMIPLPSSSNVTKSVELTQPSSDMVHSSCTVKPDLMRREAMGLFPSSSNVTKSVELTQPSPDNVHSSCGLKADPMRREEMGPFPSSSNVTEAVELTQPSSEDEGKESIGSSSLQGLPTALVSSPRRTAALRRSPSPPEPKTLTPCPAHSLSTSVESLAPFSTSLATAAPSTMSFIASSALSQVSSASSSSLRVSSVASSASSLVSSSILLSTHTEQLSASTRLRLSPSSSPAELSIQPFHRTPPSSACLEGEQSRELREQLTAAADTSQEIEREAVRRSISSTTLPATASNDSGTEARERGARLPLSIFLSERDEFDVLSMAEISGDSGRSWNTWEEPTEQIDPLCCVCMVGLKGAAFIPCGHTFCRKCSRELWRGRGSCPLCNSYIREILDVY